MTALNATDSPEVQQLKVEYRTVKDAISTPSIAHLLAYLNYQYPATIGNIPLNELCGQIAKLECELADVNAACLGYKEQAQESYEKERMWMKSAMERLEIIREVETERDKFKRELESKL